MPSFEEYLLLERLLALGLPIMLLPSCYSLDYSLCTSHTILEVPRFVLSLQEFRRVALSTMEMDQFHLS